MTRPFNTVNYLFHLAMAKGIAWWVKRFVYSISCCFGLYYLKFTKTRPSILCVTQKRAFMPLYIVVGQQRVCMPVYIGKVEIWSGDTDA